jgi:hypothetical protein
MSTTTLARPVALDRGDVLRIRGGGGLTLRPQSGVLWVTEEKFGDDRVIAPGDVCRLEGMGLALVYAHRASKVAIDIPDTLDRVPDVRVAIHGGDVSRPVALDAPAATPGVLARLQAWWRHGRQARAWQLLPSAAVGGYAEHDLYVSSRRRRGASSRFDFDPRDPLHGASLPYY